MPVAFEVRSDDAVVKTSREIAAKRVIDHFEPFPRESRVFCFLDVEDPFDLRAKYGQTTRGFYKPVHNLVDLDGMENSVRDQFYPCDFTGRRTCTPGYDALIYLFGSTCADEIGLTMTLAHELQHSIQHTEVRRLWAANSLFIGNLDQAVIDALQLEWSDIPIEVEARIVSKRVGESIFGELAVRKHIDKKIAELTTTKNPTDLRDWRFVRTILPTMTVDLVRETQRLFGRVKTYRPLLEHTLQEMKQNPDFAGVDLDAFFDPLPR
jgi:hypothetical protein